MQSREESPLAFLPPPSAPAGSSGSYSRRRQQLRFTPAAAVPPVIAGGDSPPAPADTQILQPTSNPAAPSVGKVVWARRRETGGKLLYPWLSSFLPRPCSVAQIWCPANALHDSNGAHVTYDSSHAVFLKCLHPQCLRFGGRGEFLGYIWPATITAAGVCSALITPQLERSQKRGSEVSPTTTKRPFTCSIAGSMQSLKSVS